MEKRRGRPPKSAVVDNGEEKVVEEVKATPTLIKYYNMYTDAISCGKPDNLEAVNYLKRPENGLISEMDLLAAGVDVGWLKSTGILEEYGFLPTF